ncbi:hypothetical protein DFQ26_003529 [Actinomortierella ambigua]|nr:hypothetical protein DFQ26_003529 [Actinomortierella ambigua]
MTMTGSRIPLSSLLGKVNKTLAAAFYNDMGDTDSCCKGQKAIVNRMDMYRNKANANGDVETNQEEKAAAQLRDPATTMNLSDAILSKEYRFNYLMFFGNSIAGLVFLSRLANIVKDIFGKDASNGCGRFGCILAFLCDMFGSPNIGAMHCIILTAWSIAGVGGGLLFTDAYNGLLAHHDTTKDPYIYSISLYWILAVACLGFVFLLFVGTNIRDRLLPRAEGEWMRLRLFGRLIRVLAAGIRKKKI